MLSGPSQVGHFAAQPQTPQSAHFIRSHRAHKESRGGGVGKHSQQLELAHCPQVVIVTIPASALQPEPGRHDTY
ncbi:hypothetical protein ACFWIV_29035 [Streptomyces virginiae]|uniref:hypothetical protein n=1 Tax=Streptomyces virginiae TaxID=1961 RepID=UPI0036652806